MKPAFTYGLSTGKRYWRSLEEYADSPQFREALHREFPEGASELNDEGSGGWTRRSFIGLMGASLGLAGLSGCRRPEEKILPYTKAPEEVIPGRPQFYATAMPWAGSAIGLVVESHEGRPTKIEGNALHPDSLGGTNAFHQATVLDLYDPDRSTTPLQKGAEKSWAEAIAALKVAGEASKGKGGQGLAILTREHRSPTVAALLGQVKAQLPNAKIVRWEPLAPTNARAGAKLAFGQALDAIVETGKAKVILTIDADLLWGDGRSVRNARGFADGRRLQGEEAKEMNRLYSVESVFSITGASADHRLRLPSKEIGGFVYALAGELAKQGVAIGDLAGAVAGKKPVAGTAQKWLAPLAKDLIAHKGASLIVAGERQPAEVHAVVALLNQALGNVGSTVAFVKAFDDVAEGPAAIADLAGAMKSGGVDTLLILDGNPVLDAPADLGFGDALGKVAHSFHLSHYVDETSAAATWHLNRAHFLEAWGDVKAADGTLSVVQPLVAPLYGGKSEAEVLDALLGAARKGYELVRETWKAAGFDGAWRRAVHDGVLDKSAAAAEAVEAKAADVAAAVKAAGELTGEYEVTFAADSHAWDGRFNNNGWLQEMPDPMSKLTWDNAALVSPATAKKLGVKDGDMLEIGVEGKTAVFPALVAPGHADGSIGLTVGQGRSKTGRVGTGVGFNAYALRSSKALGFASATVRAAGGSHVLAVTQEHHAMEHRDLVRETDLLKFVKKPEFAKGEYDEDPKKLFSLFPDRKSDTPHKWGMVIDLNTCIGCNGCMVSCQSENNIPLVGKEGVIASREMHWIRVDRYFTTKNESSWEIQNKILGTVETDGMLGEVEAVMQPMPCQQCENAPCEQVCPVGATTHSPEGLNDMAYNRCIGTRYCANNCPFKVRRFNFFNYAKDFPGKAGAFDRPDIQEIRRMQFNPDVTVRVRGVMEKCTYCVQRINEAKIGAHREGRDKVKDGEIKTACQQGCPTQAITFGDLNDPNSEVSKAAAGPRNYGLLLDLNIRPRTTYLARVRNPNPELV